MLSKKPAARMVSAFILTGSLLGDRCIVFNKNLLRLHPQWIPLLP